MTKEEIEKEKDELEWTIERLLSDFCERTMMFPDEIRIGKISAFGNKIAMVAKVEVVVSDNNYPAFSTEK